MKTKKYAFLFLICSIIVLIIDLIICKIFFLNIPFEAFTGLDVIVLFIFVIGTFIIAPGLEKEPKNFVSRFLVLTTVQILSALVIFAAIVFVKYPNLETVILHTLSVFVALMTIQSLLLLRFVNNK